MIGWIVCFCSRMIEVQMTDMSSWSDISNKKRIYRSVYLGTCRSKFYLVFFPAPQFKGGTWIGWYQSHLIVKASVSVSNRKCMKPYQDIPSTMLIGKKKEKKVVGIGLLSVSASLHRSLFLVLCTTPLGDGLLRTDRHTYLHLPV